MADDTESKASKPDDIPPYPAGCATVFAWMIIALPVIFLFWACGAFEDDSFNQYNDPSTPRPLDPSTPRYSELHCEALRLDALSDESPTAVDSSAKYDVWYE